MIDGVKAEGAKYQLQINSGEIEIKENKREEKREERLYYLKIAFISFSLLKI